MTVKELKTQLRDYLHVTPSHDSEGLATLNRLFLQALNNARTWAERENDFAAAQVRGTLLIPAGKGGDLTAVSLEDDTTVSVKSIINVFLENPLGSGNLYPLRRRPRSTYVGSVQRSNMLAPVHYPPDWHYPDSPHTSVDACSEVLTFGNRLYLQPNLTADASVVVDFYKWFAPYRNDSDSDFFTEHGSDFLLWKALCECNYRLEVYVPRQEGTLTPPTELRDQAWDSLLKYDAWLHEEGREHRLIT